MRNNTSSLGYLHPIKILLIFLIITEVLFFIGPIKYDIRNPLMMVLYFTILNLSLYWGYKWGIRNSKCSRYQLRGDTIKILLIIGLLLNVEYMYRKWATHGLSFSISNLIYALLNPGDAYSAEATVSINTNIITGIILTPIRWAVIPLGIYYWKKLSKIFRSVVIMTFLVYIFTWLGIGTRKGLMDLIIVTYFSVVAAHKSLLYDPTSRKKLKIITFTTLLLFVFFFIYSNASRAGLSSLNDLDQMLDRDYREFYVEHFSPNTLSAMSEVSSYLCQGYNALNISMSDIGILPPTLGGSSMSTWLYFERFFGYNPMPDTYMALLESNYGIDKYQYWHSMYLWLANDFTFIFVPLVIFFIGLYFGRVWKDAMNGENPWAYPVLGYMIIMVFYFFANNQVISFSLEPFVGCTLIYEYSRLKHRIS